MGKTAQSWDTWDWQGLRIVQMWGIRKKGEIRKKIKILVKGTENIKEEQFQRADKWFGLEDVEFVPVEKPSKDDQVNVQIWSSRGSIWATDMDLWLSTYCLQ